MNVKSCPFCGEKHCVRKGFQQGHQRWQCTVCRKKFQSNKTTLPSKEELFCLYAFNKQTLTELGKRYGIKRETLQRYFDAVVLPEKNHVPRSITLCVDTTFFGSFGVVVFRDQEQKENLWWKFVREEQLVWYAEGRLFLEALGYDIRSVTADGLPGLPSVFKGIPFQYCHFHARKTITTYLTRRPKTEAGVSLSHIMKHLRTYRYETFMRAVQEWKTTYDVFLQEKTVRPDGGWSYTHRKLRSALRSMVHMSAYLFTYLHYPHMFIPTTTNTLEGHFAHIKVRCGVHRGISVARMQKVITIILLASSVSFDEDLYKRLF